MSLEKLAASRRHDRGIWVGMASLLVLLSASAWSVDFITLTGERTIYTAHCRNGSWTGSRCSGLLVAGDRYRFRALKAHSEVLFWTAGSTQPAGKFTECQAESGRNWSCPPNADAARTVTLQMLHGEPVADASHRTSELHSISKLHWIVLRAGVSLGMTANE